VLVVLIQLAVAQFSTQVAAVVACTLVAQHKTLVVTAVAVLEIH
jgi:hypothetical protein